MRRLLLVFCVFLVVGVAIALIFRDQQGYLLVSFNGWQIETSLLFAVVVLLVGVWVVAVLWRLLVAGILLPRRFKRGLGQRRGRKARRAFQQGLLRLAEGRWVKAEKALQRFPERNESPGLNHLFAARAAQARGRITERDRYLDQAAGQRGISELAVLLTRARVQIEQGQSAEAMASLSRLYHMEPQHDEILQRYARQAHAAGDYAQVRVLVPALQKHSSMPPAEIDALAIDAWRDELSAHRSEPVALTTAWRRVPPKVREHTQMMLHYARALHEAGTDAEAADVVREALKHEWNASLVLLFGDLKYDDRTGQLATIERWLKHYGNEPELLLVAGRLCLRNRLWGRARSYFEASQNVQSRPDALLDLGRLFEEINEKEEARAAFRQGLELRTDARA